MKNLALFLLSGFLLFSTAVAAQSKLDIVDDCGFAPALKVYTVERRVRVQLGPELEIVSPYIVEKLEDGQNCLNVDVMRLDWRVKQLESPIISNHELLTDILDLQDKLKQTELALHTAKQRMETLEAQMSADRSYYERWLTALTARRPVSNPKAAASTPKAPINKPKPTVDSPKDR